MDSVAVIGASLAGLRAIETLRKEGFDGQIWLVGDEGELPYDRPPLSKQVLSGEWTADQPNLAVEALFAQRFNGPQPREGRANDRD